MCHARGGKIKSVTRISTILLLTLAAALAMAGCKKSVQNPEAVKQAILEHLGKRSDGMISAMDVDIKTVSFRTDGADATVSFKAKGSVTPGLEMSYQLELKDGKWVVKPKPAMGGDHGGATSPATPAHGAAPGSMPSNHPPIPDSSVHPKN